MVDRVSRDRQHRYPGKGGEDGDQPAQCARREPPAYEADGHRDEDVAEPVECQVAPEMCGILRAPHQGQRDRRDGRRDDRAEHRHDDIGGQHDRHGRHVPDGHRTQCQQRHRPDEQAAFGAGCVDQGTNRRVRRDADQAAHGHHEAQRGRVPMRLRHQEHADIRNEAATDIREQEIKPVECRTVFQGAPFCCLWLSLEHAQTIAEATPWRRSAGQSCASARVVGAKGASSASLALALQGRGLLVEAQDVSEIWLKKAKNKT
jgi:hypothetical protein